MENELENTNETAAITQESFLESKVFNGLQNLNDGFDAKPVHYFSEANFAVVLDRAEHYGIAIYGIEPWKNGKFFDVAVHDSFRKKATNPKWYRKAFNTFKKRDSELQYSATYKVSKKLLTQTDILK